MSASALHNDARVSQKLFGLPMEDHKESLESGGVSGGGSGTARPQ